MKKKTCCFTGHRPQSLPFGFNENDARCAALKKALREQIIHLIEKENVTHFISGMAIGIDMYAAEIVLDLKKSYPGITLESAIPCETQPVKWSEALRERYYNIAAQCDKETMLQTHYTPDCMDKRKFTSPTPSMVRPTEFSPGSNTPSLPVQSSLNLSR